jgi:AcrR family transcriptional regulator
MVPFGTMQARSRASADESSDVNRVRLIEGLLASIEEHGYAATTIADIVAHARVSKRTFYEHFADKDALFLAAYEVVSADIMRVVAEAAVGETSWQERVQASVRAYVDHLEENRALTRTFLLEIHAAGAPALKMRRGVHDQFAEMLRALVDAARAEGATVHPLSPQMAIAVVGGINELVLVALEKKHKLASLAETAATLVRAVVTR